MRQLMGTPSAADGPKARRRALPLVSVVIPAFNVEAHIGQAVRSALLQTYSNVEVIVVDDGSTDGTAGAIDPLLGDERVRYERQGNGGPHRARNRGLELARGELIAFLDADDYWYPQKLARQVPLFEGRDGPGVVYSDRHWVDAKGERGLATPEFRPLNEDRPVSKLILANGIPMSTAIANRECFAVTGRFDESLPCASDWDFWLRAAVHCWFDCVAEPLACHRRWSAQQLTANKVAQAETAIRIQQHFLQHHPGMLSRRIIRRAWARRYERRGRVLGNAGRRREGLRDLARSLWYCPLQAQAVRSMLKLALGR